MNHNPALAQSLPARELHELATSDEYSAITDELEGLSGSDNKKKRADLLASLRRLKLDALRTAISKPVIHSRRRKKKPRMYATTALHSLASAILMPVRHRLAGVILHRCTDP